MGNQPAGVAYIFSSPRNGRANQMLLDQRDFAGHHTEDVWIAYSDTGNGWHAGAPPILSASATTTTGAGATRPYAFNTWAARDVTVSLEAVNPADPTTAIASFSYGETGAQTDAATVVGSSATLTIKNHGVTTIAATARDREGNVSAPRALIVKIVSLSALSPLTAWVGLKNSDDVGLRVDLLAEVFIDGDKMAEGQLQNVSTGASGFNNAILNRIPMTISGAPSPAAAAARGPRSLAAASSSGPDPVFDTGNRRDAGSRFDATINDVPITYYLRDSPRLSDVPGAARSLIDVFVDSKSGCPDRAFKPLGTWTVTIPL